MIININHLERFNFVRITKYRDILFHLHRNIFIVSKFLPRSFMLLFIYQNNSESWKPITEMKRTKRNMQIPNWKREQDHEKTNSNSQLIHRYSINHLIAGLLVEITRIPSHWYWICRTFNSHSSPSKLSVISRTMFYNNFNEGWKLKPSTPWFQLSIKENE